MRSPDPTAAALGSRLIAAPRKVNRTALQTTG